MPKVVKPKVYKVTNTHPTYESEEAREKALDMAAITLRRNYARYFDETEARKVESR